MTILSSYFFTFYFLTPKGPKAAIAALLGKDQRQLWPISYFYLLFAFFVVHNGNHAHKPLAALINLSHTHYMKESTNSDLYVSWPLPIARSP